MIWPECLTLLINIRMSESLFQKNAQNRTDKFKGNEELNILLSRLKNLIQPLQVVEQQNFLKPQWPIGLIIGNPRSGTTLLLQWLASLRNFSYPTNVLNRFAYAPYIGSLIQQLLFDPNFDALNELSNETKSQDYKSNLGKTKGALSVAEFQHFFRNFMPNFDPEPLDISELQLVDFEGIRKGLASIESVFQKPFIVKGSMLQYNLKEVYNKLDNVIVLFIKRDPIFNMQSLLLAREKYYGDRELWWSVKPSNYSLLKDMDIYHQIAGQVYYSNLEMDREFIELPENRKLLITYESFCKSPKSWYNEIRLKYLAHGVQLKENYYGEKSFEINNKRLISNEEIKRFSDAYEYFKSISL